MPTRTRSATSSPAKAAPQALATTATTTNQNDALKLFILPKNTSPSARFVLLSQPRDQKRQRFYFCPQGGLYEITKVAAPQSDPRSVLLAPSDDSTSTKLDKTSAPATGIESGWVNKAAELLIATPFDPAFLLLPYIALRQSSKQTLFQPLDDILEEALDDDRHLRHVFRSGREAFEKAADDFCDTIEAGDEKMFRFSQVRLIASLLRRAEKVISRGLPASMEESFVTRVLERPVVAIKMEESTAITTVVKPNDPDEDEDEDEDGFSESLESQTTVVESVATLSTEGSALSSTSTLTEDSIPAEVVRLQRLKVALDFIISSFVPPKLASEVRSTLDLPSSPIDFTPLVEWMSELAKLRAEALEARSFTDLSRKRTLEDDDDAETRAEKKHRHEADEKKKKAGESRGVRDLKKVNTVGMQKMSAFFTKKPVGVKANT